MRRALLLIALLVIGTVPVLAVRTSVTLGGREMKCENPDGLAEIQVDSSLPSEGGSAPGANILIFNPKYMNRLHPVVRWFVFSHECGHLNNIGTEGPEDEMNADTFAVEKGVKEGWLTKENWKDTYKLICDSWEDAPGNEIHPSGADRCKNIDKQFNKLMAEASSSGEPEKVESAEEVKPWWKVW